VSRAFPLPHGPRVGKTSVRRAASVRPKDWSIGIDYERATWLQLKDSETIVAALRGLDYDVDDGPTAQAILNDSDFGNAR
jgi:hypothetical protein